MTPDIATFTSTSFFFLYDLHFGRLCCAHAGKRVVVIRSPGAFVKRPLCILRYIIRDCNTVSQFLLCRKPRYRLLFASLIRRDLHPYPATYLSRLLILGIKIVGLISSSRFNSATHITHIAPLFLYVDVYIAHLNAMCAR